MILVAISSHAWTFQREAAQVLLNRLAQSDNFSNAVVFDRHTIAREAQVLNGKPVMWSGHEISFSSWLKDGMVEDGVIDNPAIRNTAAALSTDKMVVLDASGHRDKLIIQAMGQARYAWFPLDKWHPVFVLVCDDIYLLKLADILAFTFYCQPETLTDREAKRIARTVHRRGFTYRWLGPGAGKFEAKVYKWLSVIVNWWDKTQDRNEIRKQ